jgi:hypothetical protein
MLDLIPLAGSRREMTDFHDHPRLVGELLEFEFPESGTGTVAATAICRDEQSPRVLIALPAQPIPPAADRFHGELGRIVGDSHGNASFVVVQIIDPVRNRLSQFRIRKIVNMDFHGLSFAAVRFTGILQFSQHFFLLRVDRQRWFAGGP